MRRYFILTVSCLFCFQLAGCWVRIPDNHDPEYSPYIGKTAKTRVDLYIQDPFFSFTKIAVANTFYLLKERDYMTLPAGSVLKITGVATRRVKAGVDHYVKCIYESEGKSVIFDCPAYPCIKKHWGEPPYFEFIDPPPSHKTIVSGYNGNGQQSQ